MSVKSDLLKEINNSVKRKKLLAEKITQPKTIFQWTSDFFSEVHKFKSNQTGISLALMLLSSKIKTVDPKSYVLWKDPYTEEPIIEIHWSSAYADKNNCEQVLVLDEATSALHLILQETE